ncbi:MAG: PEP-utilizing enzyme [Candidatus Magasanikbacteria bacterium]
MKKRINLIEKFRALSWDVWLTRQFSVLVPYLMAQSATKKAFVRQGINGHWPIILFEDGVWYSNDQMFSLAGKEAKKYLQRINTRYLVKVCELGYKRALKEVEKINKDIKADPVKQYKRVITLLEPINVSVWTAHASEVYFHQELTKKLATLVVPKDIEKFIGDIGFPKKKNAHALMADDILKGISVHELFEKYAWLKSRNDIVFGNGYTLEEVKNLRKEILTNPPLPIKRPPVPNNLKKLARDFQDIVYLRTLRSDSLFEIYFRAQPIFARVAKHFNIDSVAHYVPDDLFAGKIERYSGHFAVLKYYDDILVTKERIVKSAATIGSDVKGVAAFFGKARGAVKIVFCTGEINKVKDGDILITNMTIPAYLSAMQRAAAFVTDEGGITCHAAILARELKKPCIIGTKNATKVFKDGDTVEVDAEKGIVRKVGA